MRKTAPRTSQNFGRQAWLAPVVALLGLMLVQDFAAAQSVRPPANAVQNAQPKADANEAGGRGAVPADDLWGNIRKGAQGNVSIPDKKAGILVQSGGETWRNFRNGPLATYGAWAMGGMLALLGLFYLLRGKIRIEAGWSGRTIKRFPFIERVAHWMMASSFIVLGLSGLNVLYGRYVLMPLIGKEAFSSVSIGMKWLHNHVAFAFMLSLLLSFVFWLRHNFPNTYDLKWLAQGGGMFSKHGHPPAKKFNPGQKILFWMIMLGGVSISMSGWAMMNPGSPGMFAKTFGVLNVFGLGLPTNATLMQEIQFATVWHSILAIFLICVIFGHIYIGTLGMQGAFDAMGSGNVDENWAMEHHSVWAEEELAKKVVDVGLGGRPQPAA
jgi:formate dehydrogenase subunit gamma